MMKINAVWDHLEGKSSETFTLKEEGDRLIAQGDIHYTDVNACKVKYQIELDKNWMTKRLSIGLDDTTRLEIHTDEEGTWCDANGESIDTLTGAIDVDISATPFTNSLPINRLNWKLSERRDFQMVYISVPDLELKQVSQTYELIREEGELRLFKYRSNTYEAMIGVDVNGLVVHYPGLFKRRN